MQDLGGSIARQIAKLANRNIPYRGCHVQSMNEGWPRGRNLSFSFSWVQILSCPGVWTLPGAWFFSGVLPAKSASSGFCNRCSGTDSELVIRWWENCILYSLCSIFSSSSISNISSVVLLNSVSTHEFTSCLFCSPSHWRMKGRGERVAV